MSDYFTKSDLLSPPMQRAAYSDRMAYVLGEMSDLAYFPFEKKVGNVAADAAKEILEKAPSKNAEEIEKVLSQFIDNMDTAQKDNRGKLEEILHAGGFSLIETFDKGTTQAFLCCHLVDDKPSYLVLAFRGTEKKPDDWLTDANALPHEEEGYRVHTGFYDAFNLVKDDIIAALKGERCFDSKGKPLPLFITGHSLGGALAVLATKYIARNVEGACYTYGGPRVANYEFFFGVKTPIYRIVNSSDIVPRVPPGALVQVLIGGIKLLAWISSPIAPLKSSFLWLEKLLDKLNGYRHYGDLRYLTDVQGGRFEKVRLVLNPPLIDRIRWFWKHLGASFFMPMKMHSMVLYRKKLAEVASQRKIL